MDRPSSEQQDLRALEVALAVYVVIFVMKLVVYFASGVMALLGEALHTLTDIFISAFLLAAIKVSRRQPDQVHMFGYGRAQNVASLVAATLFISFTSYKLYEEAVPRFFSPPHQVYHNLGLAIGVVVVSMFIAAVPLVILLRRKQAERQPERRCASLSTTNWDWSLPYWARSSSRGACRLPIL